MLALILLTAVIFLELPGLCCSALGTAVQLPAALFVLGHCCSQYRSMSAQLALLYCFGGYFWRDSFPGSVCYYLVWCCHNGSWWSQPELLGYILPPEHPGQAMSPTHLGWVVDMNKPWSCVTELWGTWQLGFQWCMIGVAHRSAPFPVKAAGWAYPEVKPSVRMAKTWVGKDCCLCLAAVCVL